MSRLTGSDVKNMMEACAEVYAPQELTEEQIWEEVENWVNSLLEEGYDLSEYTWEEMYEAYLKEAAPTVKGSGGNLDQFGNRATAYIQGAQLSRGGDRNRLMPTLAGAGGNEELYRERLRYAVMGAQDARRADAARAAAARAGGGGGGGAGGGGGGRGPQTVAAAGGAGGRVTVGRQYAATQGGVQGNVTYNAQGQRTFTPNRPAPGSAAPAAGAPGGPRITPTSTPAPAAGTPAAAPARPSLQSGIEDLQRMRAASLMRQQGRTMPDGSIPTGSSLAPRPAPAPAPSGALATTAAAASRPAVYNPAPAAATPAPAPAVTSAPTPTAAPAAAPVATNTVQRPVQRRPAPTRAPILQRQSFDPFDIIMGHLIDEGYAEDEKAAAVIMANMSEEWRQSIVEMNADNRPGKVKSAPLPSERKPSTPPPQNPKVSPEQMQSHTQRRIPPSGATVYTRDSYGRTYTHTQR